MPYPGGKSQAGVFQRIINLIPPHETFVELFAGSAAIARLKAPAARTVLVDKLLLSPDPAWPPGTEFLRECGIQYAERVRFPPSTVIYADPPYVPSTRRRPKIYRHEMTEADHVRLLRALLVQRCPVIISGYPSTLYARFLGSWNCEEFEVMTQGNTWATEALWFNFPKPTQLHDFRRVGEDYRDRWRIKKKIRRWTARLARQDPLERSALLAAIDQTRALFPEACNAGFGADDVSNAESGAVVLSAENGAVGRPKRRRPTPVLALGPGRPAPAHLELRTPETALGSRVQPIARDWSQ